MSGSSVGAVRLGPDLVLICVVVVVVVVRRRLFLSISSAILIVLTNYCFSWPGCLVFGCF